MAACKHQIGASHGLPFPTTQLHRQIPDPTSRDTCDSNYVPQDQDPPPHRSSESPLATDTEKGVAG